MEKNVDILINNNARLVFNFDDVLVFLSFLSLWFLDFRFFNINLSTYLFAFLLIKGFFKSFISGYFTFFKTELNYLILFYVIYILIILRVNFNFDVLLKLSSYLVYILVFIVLKQFIKRNFNSMILFLQITYVLHMLSFILFADDKLDVNVFLIQKNTSLGYFLTYIFYLIVFFSKGLKSYNGVYVFMHLLLLLVIGAKGPLLISLLISFALYFKKARIEMFFILSIFSLLFYVFKDNFSFIIDRVNNAMNLDSDSSSGYRLSVIRDGFMFILNNPLGAGYGSFNELFYNLSELNLNPKTQISSDNSFVQIGFNAGVIPLILLFYYFVLLIKNMRVREFSFFLIIFLHFIFDNVVENGFFLVFIALNYAFIYEEKKLKIINL